MRWRPGTSLEIVSCEAAPFPIVDSELAKRLPAFFAVAHYGIYTPLYTNRYGGTLSVWHTDFTIENLRRWIAIVR